MGSFSRDLVTLGNRSATYDCRGVTLYLTLWGSGRGSAVRSRSGALLGVLGHFVPQKPKDCSRILA